MRVTSQKERIRDRDYFLDILHVADKSSPSETVESHYHDNQISPIYAH